MIFFRYWNMVHGATSEDVEKDLKGMQTMRILGRNMTFLIKAIALAKKEYGMPKKESDIHTHSFHD